MLPPTENIREFLRAEPSCVLVTVSGAAGSTPRDTDAWMVVSRTRLYGTIGGGQLEFMAIDQARRALRNGFAAENLDVPLGPAIGQCCGGRVGLSLAHVTEETALQLVARSNAEMAARPHVYVFGAGHVGRVLTAALALAPLRVVLVDTREGELSACPVLGVETCLTPMPEAVVRNAPPRSAFVVLTHDHALDFLIVAEALQRDDAVYVGMIGSKTKRATLRNWLAREAGGTKFFDRLICPIGGKVKDKRPSVIATLVAAEILTATLAEPQDRKTGRARANTEG
ncbi:xanthine dehydrogenase accessory protein XdhC [Methylobacterium brachythecii]|uniref:Xanthine dehydrogenase accessory factor n=1 Tax=Methylobacterium brachythecii TaxID=1176177 RepID=A0A7W6F829_9HYPH|nr:xanthine dehydrogenase accessory protein XdhC [Methylobacterium brachythecii]MBB3903994.1 xanthine dehydrogenase accessory factor [Methylobacterium brachythecii]GLS42735.1 xanthine dehydrogenase accessory protein XdhC [Methylobacterium brachythecii]